MKAKRFAVAYAKQMISHYGNTRGQGDIERLYEQVWTSKVFEFQVYNYLKSLGYTVSEPDCVIYESRKKSYDADLTANGDIKIHIKSQELRTIRSRDFISWGFQSRDPLFHSPSSKDFIFAGLYVDEHNGQLLVSEQAVKVMPHAEDSVNPKFWGNKKFLYMQTLQNRGME